MVSFAVVISIVFPVLIVSSDAKSCTNLFQSNSLLHVTSTNESWRREARHLTHTDEHTWAHLLPRKILRQQADSDNWDMVYRMMKNPIGLNPPTGILKEVSLHNVTLHPGSVHGRAQQTNLDYLLMLDVDRLVWSFRKTAGLPTLGTPYGGWEAPNMELRGHFVG